MKVTLVNPPKFNGNPYIREGRCMQSSGSWGSLWMPLSLAYTASCLRRNNHEIELIDCQSKNLDQAELADCISTSYSSIIILNTGFPSIKGDMQTAKAIKTLAPSVKIVVIGMYPTLLGKNCLDEFPQVDFAIIGEPEWVASRLVDSIQNNDPLSEIKGLVYRTGNGVVENLPQDFHENDINDLPFPARDLLDNDSYRLVSTNTKFTHINIARGCPYKCSFCAASKYNSDFFRKRNIESILAEIEECIDKYSISNFIFWFEEYSFDHIFIDRLCAGIIKKGFHINWFARSRADNLTKNSLMKMKDSGCKGLSMGIESANQCILDNVHKEITVEQIKIAIKNAKQVGIPTTGHFIFGLPGETKETAYETIVFAKNSGLDFAQFYCAVPYPKTPFGDLAKNNGWICTEDYSRYNLSESVCCNEYLSPDEIMNIRRQAYKIFYMTPKYLWKAMKLAVKHKSSQPLVDFTRWSR